MAREQLMKVSTITILILLEETKNKEVKFLAQDSMLVTERTGIQICVGCIQNLCSLPQWSTVDL